jgi:phenylacetate-CoA ligase
MCKNADSQRVPERSFAMNTHWKPLAYFTLKRVLKGSRVHAHYRYLHTMQRLPAATQQAEQTQLLATLCANAARDVPAYRARFRAAGVDPAQLRTEPGLLARIQPLFREEIRDNQAAFLRAGTARADIELISTGGTGGSPLTVARDAHAKDWWLAESFLLNAWSGLGIGVPYFFLWGASQDIAGTQAGLRPFNLSFLHGRRTLNASRMSRAKEVAFLEELNRTPRCAYIFGYANELHNLAVRSLQSGPALRRPLKGVIATAEPLTEAMRSTIERAFQCPVYNRYGSREAGDIASECKHQRGLHVNPLFTHVEVVDDLGEPLGYGQEGQFLVTNLHNHVMPLIRYAIGDRGVLQAPEPCSCGVSWPTIVALTGRVNDWVFLSDGSRLRCSVLESVLVQLPAIKRFQIHQISETHLRIRLSSLEPDYLTRRSQELSEARHKLSLLSGAPFDIQFEVTDGALFKTQAGKEPLITYASTFRRAQLQGANAHTRVL